MRSIIFILTMLISNSGFGFCGFFVGKAGADLFNESSQVVLARDGNRTVVSMANDYKGELKEFALVVPVPVVLKKEQVHVTSPKNIAHLDAFTSPRLAEYNEDDPCAIRLMMDSALVGAMPNKQMKRKGHVKKESRGVKIEAQYTVGEYDILILSAKESGGLLDWLNENGYKTPKAALPILNSYIKQKLKFFVAKINLKEKAKSSFDKLRPLQIAYESDRFMLPIRLGTVNAKGNQDLIIYMLSPKGRVEVSNYPTKQVPANMDLPVEIKKNFQRVYKDLFIHQANKEKNKAVFLEYAWDMNWCDPCASDPLSKEQLLELGAMWLVSPNSNQKPKRVGIGPRGGAVNAYVTRYHLRYNKDTFPEDLKFFETSNRQNFQARYVVRNKWNGTPTCDAAKTYLKTVKDREQKEIQTLASLTGWEKDDFSKKLNLKVKSLEKEEPWYKKIWK